MRAVQFSSGIAAALAALLVCACGGSSVPVVDGSDAATAVDAGSDDAFAGGDGDAKPPIISDSGASVDDGPPTRVACTSSLGKALTTAHGRLDGFLVALVPSGTPGCNSDSSHLHLQIKMGGAVYDVAVNVDGLLSEADVAMPDGAWSEGWHPSSKLDYVSDLGIHAPAFVQSSPAAEEQQLEGALKNANHVSIFATGYGPDGVHLVHRNGNGNDGAIFINPLSTTPHAIVFRFATQSF